MRFETEIANATIITPEGGYRGTPSIADGRIAAILEEPSGEANRTVDAKGALRVGSDADVVLVDVEQEHTLHDEDIVSKAGWTPFDGLRVQGRPVMTFLRGTLIAKHGEVVVDPGVGLFAGR